MRRSAPALSTLRTSCRNRRRHSAGAATAGGGGSAGRRKQQRGSSVCNVGRRRCSISRRGSGPPAAACEGVDVLIRRAAEPVTSLLFTRRPRLRTSSSPRHPHQRQLPASALPPQEVPTRTRPRARRRQASRCPAPADTCSAPASSTTTSAPTPSPTATRNDRPNASSRHCIAGPG